MIIITSTLLQRTQREQAPSDTRVEAVVLLAARLVCQLCFAKDKGSFNDASVANVLSVSVSGLRYLSLHTLVLHLAQASI